MTQSERTTPSRLVRHDGTVAESESPERTRFSRQDFTGSAGVGPVQSVNPVSVPLSGDIRPSQLRGYDGPLYVINKTRTVISHDEEGIYLRIEPSYNRDHITPLPLKVAQSRGFQRLWRTGRVRVSTDENLENMLGIDDGDENDMGGMVPFTLDDSQGNSLIQFACMICEVIMFLSQNELHEGVPPLCEDHVDSVGMLERVIDMNNRPVWQLKDSVQRR